MKILRTVEDVKKELRRELPIEVKNYRKVGRGFVPTMGALHQGHISLIQKSQSENSETWVSIYLNSTQFNNKDDFDKYPSQDEKDIEILEREGVDVLFMPTYDQIYPDNYNYKIIETKDSQELCGVHRPGHFDGVLTVVMKLLNIIRPQKIYMGEKDYQQLKLVEGMIKTFFLDVELVACPTWREGSGLAMSSRNQRLSKGGVEKASNVYRILSSKELKTIEEKREGLENLGFKIEYLEQKFDRLFIAAELEGVRLIDNVALEKNI